MSMVAHIAPILLPPAASTTVTACQRVVSGSREARVLRVPGYGARRASTRRSTRAAALILFGATLAFGGIAVSPSDVSAAGKRVVVVVGPTGSHTGDYIKSAKSYAAKARSYGATVVEIYSPYATWSKVKSALQGANMLIYLGHGNGWPSPYGPFQRYTKDGLGLNSTAGNGHYNVKYWGEYYIDRYVQMADDAVVILNRLCYASGNSEWGSANPTKSVAIQRVDNYGAGFLRANAKAVFAEAVTSVGYIIQNLFSSQRTMKEIFLSSPSRTMTYRFGFTSTRTSGMWAILDPSAPGRYYRSVIGKLSTTAASWRAG